MKIALLSLDKVVIAHMYDGDDEGRGCNCRRQSQSGPESTFVSWNQDTRGFCINIQQGSLTEFLSSAHSNNCDAAATQH